YWSPLCGYQLLKAQIIISLTLDILNGKREQVTHGSPIEYYNLQEQVS
ncbi:6688_t:CDS:2, partial [Rhizophagus irregularis]